MIQDEAAGRRRAILQEAFRSATAAASADEAVRRFCTRSGDVLYLGGEETVELSSFSSVWIVGAGKATPGLAEATLDVLDGRCSGGTIATKDGHGRTLPIDLWEAGHPIPDVRSLAAAAEVLRLVRSTGPDDLLICLLSGGASALWCAPASGLTLTDLQRVTERLLRAGVPIHELNTVRKHLSRIAGGRLAGAAGAGRIVTLVVSDVLGDSPGVIGSGPTVPDPSTYADALEVLRPHAADLPPAVMGHLDAGAGGELPETPKPGDPIWNRASFHIVASLREALAAAASALEHHGYRVRIVDADLTGEARLAGAALARTALDSATSSPGVRQALLWGGETTVTVRGSGKGGRNQEMALAAALELDGRQGIVVGCFGTDGTDGPTEAAGGFADGTTVARAEANGVLAIDALERNDSFSFLAAAGDLIVTGPTGTNVNDIAVALLDPTVGGTP